MVTCPGAIEAVTVFKNDREQAFAKTALALMGGAGYWGGELLNKG